MVATTCGSSSGHCSAGAVTFTALEYTVTPVAPRSNSRRANTSGGRPPFTASADGYRSMAMPVSERLRSNMRTDGDVLGDAPLDAYDRSAAIAAAVFRAPGAMDAPCAVSYGPVPGSVYCGHRFLDVLIHGWDVARSTGQPAMLDAGLVEACWAVIEPQLEMLVGSGVFGTEVVVPEDADRQTRLLAVLGRRA